MPCGTPRQTARRDGNGAACDETGAVEIRGARRQRAVPEAVDVRTGRAQHAVLNGGDGKGQLDENTGIDGHAEESPVHSPAVNVSAVSAMALRPICTITFGRT